MTPTRLPSQPLPPDVVRALGTGHDALSTWWPAVGAGAVAGTLAVLAVRQARAGRRIWVHVVKAAFVTALGVGFAANAWVGYVPSIAAARLLLTHGARPGTATSGAVTPHVVPAPAPLRMPASTTFVYTPPGYDPAAATRYPVVYLVHGSPGTSADWFAGGDVAHVMDVLIAHGLVQPMIVVAPDVNGTGPGATDTECLDSTRGGSQVETYLSTVLVPWVDAHFRTRADWQHRAIGGMSAGGFCALDQGLRHPELYGMVLAIEGDDTPGTGAARMLATPQEVEAHSPGRYVDTMTFAHPVTVFLSVGGQAGADARGSTQRLADGLVARGQAVLSRVEPGQHHTWTTARTAIPYGLVLASQQFSPSPS